MKLAIFDFDGTLLRKDTLPCLGKEWLRQKRSKTKYIKILLSTLPLVFLYKTGFMSRETMKGLAFFRFNRFFIHMTRQEIQEFFSQAYPHLFPFFNRTIIEEIKLAQQNGFHCVLLSGTYSDLLQTVAKNFGISSVIGANLAYKNNVFDQKGNTPYIDGEGKLSLLLKAFSGEEVDWEASKAYGDSYSDICIMEHVGEGIAVNPDPKLLHYARINKWRVID